MLNKLKKKLTNNTEIIALGLLLITTILSTTYYNFNKQKIYNNYKNIINNIYFKKTINHFFENLEPKFKTVVHIIREGETFDKILKSYDIKEDEILSVKKKLSKRVNLNKLTTNQKIQFTINQSDNQLKEFIFQISSSEKIYLTKNKERNDFNKEIILTKLYKEIVYDENIILNSLYNAALKKGVPINTIIEFARIYGFEVDFQRDIRKRDSFQIMYEVYKDDNKKIIETGEILFANLKLSGKDKTLYFFSSDNTKGHFDKNGKSSQKALMKTPINGARLSSPFGMRKHPIDGFNKMHRGTDFAAPTGTPIMASGNGVVKKAGWCGGGGNCVVIKHNSTYQTVYAHMSKFGRGIKKGTRVKQGQIIGYVGSTGLSTGPHLHYEVIENGRKINSQTLKLPSGKTLKGKERKEFEVVKIKTNVLISEIINQ